MITNRVLSWLPEALGRLAEPHGFACTERPLPAVIPAPVDPLRAIISYPIPTIHHIV
jgi:hypothetical protein